MYRTVWTLKHGKYGHKMEERCKMVEGEAKHIERTLRTTAEDLKPSQTGESSSRNGNHEEQGCIKFLAACVWGLGLLIFV